MAKAQPANLPLDLPSEVTLEVAPAAVTPVEPTGPLIEYLSEEAKLVAFEINPKASKYVVRADGQIIEHM